MSEIGIPKAYLELHDMVSDLVESTNNSFNKRLDDVTYEKLLSVLSDCNRAHTQAKDRVRYVFTVGSNGDASAGIHAWEDTVTIEFTGPGSPDCDIDFFK